MGEEVIMEARHVNKDLPLMKEVPVNVSVMKKPLKTGRERKEPQPYCMQ